MGNNRDDAGHIQGHRLGGSGTDERNIIPQSPTINRGTYRQYEDIVFDVVQRFGGARFIVNLEYASDDVTRPNLFVFRIEKRDGTFVHMDSVINPE